MLYDLNFLNKGKIFPPLEEVERLQKYKDNRLLFKSSTYDVYRQKYKDAEKRITRILNDYQDMIAYPIELNYHKLTSIKTADFMVGEKPQITCGEKDLNSLVFKDTGFFDKLYKIAIDISRFGDCFTRIYLKNGKGALAIPSPSTVFKIVDIEDSDNITCYVVATAAELPSSTKDNPLWELRVQEHYVGYYDSYALKIKPVKGLTVYSPEKQICNLQSFEIAETVSGKQRIETGINDNFAILHFHNIVTSDDCYGHDDYEVIDAILSEVWTRLGQVAIILDKHANPNICAPQSAFKQDLKTGVWSLKAGNAFITNPGETPASYLVWEGQLIAAFNEINLLMEQLYILTEMGAVYKAALPGSNIAYETMKATFTSALTKASRLTEMNHVNTVKLVSQLGALCGVELPESDIEIKWQDGLPNDEKIEIDKSAQVISAKLFSRRREWKQRFGLTDEAIDELYEELLQEESDFGAVSFGLATGGGGKDDGEKDE